MFEDNDFSRSGRAGMFAGFMLSGVVTRNPGLINTNKYLVDSRFTIVMDESAGELDYDNPILDPFDRLTPLNNILVVNGASLRDRRVTCPPGFPCAPLDSRMHGSHGAPINWRSRALTRIESKAGEAW